MSLTFRPYAAGDDGALFALWLASWRTVYPDADIAGRWPQMLVWWKEMLEAGGLIELAHVPAKWKPVERKNKRKSDMTGALSGPARPENAVAHEGGRLAGFIVLDTPDTFLYHLVVHPDFFGSGIATTLLDRIKVLCPSGFTLNVLQSNTRAIGFYRREGLHSIGEGVSVQTGLPNWTYAWRPGQ